MLLTGRRREALLLTGTLTLAAVVTAGISGWVLAAGPTVGVSEALRTGGVAGASVVALYALWLNDRRRRVEEDRQAVEEERLRVERGRTSHERFARAIEMLGNDADQVRVGAMHALVGLSRDTPSYTQTVIDILCSYLRRPFF
ncbi:MAG: pentapeptide repeat-containing protein, partial [Actinomycetes bacterium]